MKRITIIVPCYNEEAVVASFYAATKAVTSKVTDYDFTYLFVNDGSTDGTLDILKNLHEATNDVAYVSLSRNFGKEAAMLAGFDQVDTDAIIIMDADLQDSPCLIPRMIKYWEDGYDDVSAKRRSRAGESFMKRTTSHLYYRLLQKITPIPIQPDVGDFRLLDRKCVDALKKLRETQRYTKGLFSWIGYKKKEILFDRPARAAGTTKWSYGKLLGLAIDGITSFTTVPLRVASIIGVLLAFIGGLYMVFIMAKTALYGTDVAGYPSLICIILFIGGIQLIFLGIMGEYIGRIFKETKERPVYLIGEKHGPKRQK